jgi:stage III sporulation protein AE
MLHCCLLLGFSASVANLTGISQIAQSVRRFFVGMVGCVSAILTAVFAFQSVIAAKADTFGARTVRYVTTSVLPLVGGALSEASRTLSSAFSLVGGVLGGVGVAVVVLLLLPILLELWMLRLAFSAAGGMAQMLGCERLGMLYRQGGTLFGALLAIVSLLDAVLVFEFALMMKI